MVILCISKMLFDLVWYKVKHIYPSHEKYWLHDKVCINSNNPFPIRKWMYANLVNIVDNYDNIKRWSYPLDNRLFRFWFRFCYVPAGNHIKVLFMKGFVNEDLKPLLKIIDTLYTLLVKVVKLDKTRIVLFSFT